MHICYLGNSFEQQIYYLYERNCPVFFSLYVNTNNVKSHLLKNYPAFYINHIGVSNMSPSLPRNSFSINNHVHCISHDGDCASFKL